MPIGYAYVLSSPTIKELADKYQATPTQIVLAWHISRGVAAVPRSANPEHQKQNLNLPTRESEDVQKINALDRYERVLNKVDDKGFVWGMKAEELGW